MYSEDAYKAADQVVAGLTEAGLPDYTAGRDELARVFETSLWHGNWDSSTDFEQAGLPLLTDLRLIQEDEYDQSVDNDQERPDDHACYAAGYYVFLA